MAQNINFFILIIIMILLPQTFAPWIENWEYTPDPGEMNSCENWIINSGFQNNTINEYIRLARTRDRNFDSAVSAWALMYAQILIAFPLLVIIDNYSPFKYCKDHGMEHSILLFQTISNLQKKCKDWVQLYNYHVGLTFTVAHRNDDGEVQYRDTSEDQDISLWAAGYARLLSNFDVSIDIDGYCARMVPKDIVMPFMSINGATKPCHEWIQLSGFNDSISSNVKRAKKLETLFDDFVSTWTKHYIHHLRTFGSRPIYCTCCFPSGDTPLKPIAFCQSILQKPPGLYVYYYERLW